MTSTPHRAADTVRQPSPSTVAAQLADVLVDWGVRHVFICPGSTEAAFLHALAARSDLEVVLTTHESITVSMADGYARESGNPSVAYLHANVGLTNGLSHLYAAQLAYSPVLILTGLKQRRIQAHDGFTTAPYMRDFVRQYSKWSWQSMEAEAVCGDVGRALQLASTAPRGPSWVGLAQDLAEAVAESDVPPRSALLVAGETRAGREIVERTATALSTARRPMIVAGADLARSAGAVSALVALAERFSIPVFAEDRRAFERTAFPVGHRHYAGMYSVDRATVAEADLLVFVGARCFHEFETPTRSDLPEGARVIHVHPDANEVGKIYGADVAAVGDSGLFVLDLQELMESHAPVDDPDRHEGARREHLAIVEAALAPPSSEREHTTVAEVMSGLADALTDDHIVVGDATTSGKALIHAVERAGVPMHTTSSGSLGWGIGAALGVQLARPHKRVISVCGDGVFQFGLPGLWTAARYRIPVTWIVINNAAYAAVGAALRRHLGALGDRERELVVDLSGPSISSIAEGFGLDAIRTSDPGELVRLLRDDSAMPRVIEVLTDPFDLGP